jgi:hypothetical protein
MNCIISTIFVTAGLAIIGMLIFIFRGYILYNIKWLWLLLKCITYLCLFFLIYNFFCPFPYLIRPNHIIDQTLFDIKIDSTVDVLKIQAVAHNKILIDVLQQRLAIDYNNLNSSLNVKMQFRSFYIAILAGLSSLLFHKDIMWKSKIRITLLFFIIIMYFLEVHYDDFNTRKNDISCIMYKSANLLVNLKPNDSTWYELQKWDSKLKNTVGEKWDSVSTKGTIHRKLKSALSLNVEQVVYYLIPWGMLFFIPPYFLNRKNEYRRKYGSPRSKGT